MRWNQAGERAYSSKEELLSELCDDVKEEIKAGLRRRERFALALSGGRTPSPLLRALSKENLPWERVDVHLVDERWVPSWSEESNEKMVRERLLVNAGAKARLVALPDRGLSTQKAVVCHHQTLGGGPLRLDLTLLGMGEDGHVASLFPGDQNSEQALARENRETYCATHAPGGCRDRIGLTCEGILRSRRLGLLITGEAKRALYLKGVPEDPAQWLPVHHLMNQSEVPLAVYWAP